MEVLMKKFPSLLSFSSIQIVSSALHGLIYFFAELETKKDAPWHAVSFEHAQTTIRRKAMAYPAIFIYSLNSILCSKTHQYHNLSACI